MEKVEVKPTWQLAWGLSWRIFLICLGIEAIVFGIIYAVLGPAFFSLLLGIPAY